MAQTPPPPLDPSVAALLRTTAFGAPPDGAKRRVRSQLALAGIVGAMGDVGAGSAATSTVPPPSPLSAHGAWTGVDATGSWRAIVAGKAALPLLAGIAMGTAATLLSLMRGPILHRSQRARQEEIVRSLPSMFPETVIQPERDPAAVASAPSMVAPRSASPSLKRSGTAETLGYEQRLLAKARAALGRGELDAAMQELDRHARLFPNGNLNEEREALRVVTLAQQGNLTSARERAARFRRAYPRSIQMSTVDGALGDRR